MILEVLFMLSSAAAAADLPVDKQDEGKVTCRRFYETGSRVTNKKVCKTAKEWEEDRIRNGEVIRDQRGGRGGPQMGNEG